MIFHFPIAVFTIMISAMFARIQTIANMIMLNAVGFMIPLPSSLGIGIESRADDLARKPLRSLVDRRGTLLLEPTHYGS